MHGPTRFPVDSGWRIILKDLGLDARAALQRANLPGDILSRRDATLSTEEYFRFWSSLYEASEDPCFPIRLVTSMSSEAFDPVLFAALCSPNLNVALKRISQFKPLLGPMKLHVTQTATKTEAIVEFRETALDVPPALAAAELIFFVQFARMATREHIVPLEVASPAELGDCEEYAEFFGIQPGSSKRIRVAFSAKDAARPFVTESARMWSFFEPGLQQRLSELGGDASFSDRVRGALLELLPSGYSSVDDVAKKLAVSKRTLQRRLQDEATNYLTVLNDVREDLAMHYLKNSSLSSAKISYLLGFQDPNSFFRAFHAWSGSTPDRVRTSAQQRH